MTSINLNQIDLCQGEPHIVRESLISTFGLEKTLFTTSLDKKSCSYPPLKGYTPLVKLLEGIHDAPVIITNGAKQSLAAIFYALTKMGKKSLGYRKPYWSQIPELAKRIGLTTKTVEFDAPAGDYCDAYLSVMPRNPDGHIENYGEHKFMGSAHRSLHVPFIHDAAYYSPVYLPDDYELGAVGDAQIFSASKMYGLSGLRIGYTAFYDADLYKHVLDYVEHMTVGVSIPSQEIYHDILQTVHNSQAKSREFVLKCRDDLYRAKFLARTINRNVLEIPDNIEHVPGMFLWAKLKDRTIFDKNKANIKVGWGEDFGVCEHVRINLAAPIEDLKEAIRRINLFS